MPLNGNSLKRNEDTGFLEPSKNYSLTGFDSTRKQQILEYLKINWNISAACEHTGISRQVFYYAFKDDPEFKSAVDNVRESHLDQLEQTMFNNAKTEKGTADRIFALKSWRRERYGERVNLTKEEKTDADQLFSRLTAQGKLITIESAKNKDDTIPSDKPTTKGNSTSSND